MFLEHLNRDLVYCPLSVFRFDFCLVKMFVKIVDLVLVYEGGSGSFVAKKIPRFTMQQWFFILILIFRPH